MARLPLWKQAVFSLLVTLAFFGTAEVVLLLAGVRPVFYDEDPFVGFSSTLPLFVEETRPDGSSVRVTSRSKLAFFNPQEFPAAKRSDAYRIFCVGGSTTYGRPYDHATSFCGWLDEFLREADPSRTWEVINAGGVSYASYRVATLMEELSGYEPDLFIIYSGHNEFLERRTYRRLLETPSALLRMAGIASRLRTYSAMKRTYDRLVPTTSIQKTNRDILPEEVETILEKSIGPSAYTRGDPPQDLVLRHYRYNLERMLEIARSAGAEAMMVMPASNLRSASPFKSEHRPGLGDADRRRWEVATRKAEAASLAGEPEKALPPLEEALAIDDRHAHLHYLRGRVLYDLNRIVEAKLAFTRARDEDICPLRALTPMTTIVSEVARDWDVRLIDFVSLVESRSENGIAGDDLFVDHLHPTIEGNRMLAISILDEMVDRGIVRPTSEWGEGAIETVSTRVRGGIDPRAHAMALLNLAKVLSWAGKFEEADELALRVVERLPDNANAKYLAGRAYERRGRIDLAVSHYEEAIRSAPRYSAAHNNLGLLLLEQGSLRDAEAHFEQALGAGPNYKAHHNLAMVQERLGNPAGAAEHYEEAIRLNPEGPETHYSLGLLSARQGDLDEAALRFEQVLEIEPDHVRAHNNLGAVFARRGDLTRAVAHFESALRLDPASAVAEQNLERARRLLESAGESQREP